MFVLPALAATIRVLRTLPGSASDAISMEQLRSDLSHEPAAKLARLQGLAEEWRHGRCPATDLADARALLLDLERLHLRHVRLACAAPNCLVRLLQVLAAIGAARGVLRRLTPGQAPQSAEIERFTLAVDELRTHSRGQVEVLSRAQGARLTELVSAAVDAVRAECGHGAPEGIGIALQGAPEAAGLWVARGEATRWTDLLRNLVRNAVQATEDRRLAAGASEAEVPNVQVRVEPLRGRAGVLIEVTDEGVGMDAAAIESMWRTGTSSHGAHRGEGLTEGKHAFLLERAQLEVRSAKERGTCVRIEVPHREVPVQPPRLWAIPVVTLPALAAALALFFVSAAVLPPRIARVDVLEAHVVRAFDDRGRVLWERTFKEEIAPNWRSSVSTPTQLYAQRNQYLLLRGRSPWSEGVILATQPRRGPGHLVRIDARGATVWSHELSWQEPTNSDIPPGENLRCIFEVPVPWNGDPEGAIAVNVRRGDYSSTAIEFFTPDGQPIGAYYHPGQLQYFDVVDVQGDGRPELVMTGVNNPATHEREFLPVDPGNVYVDCLLMLRPPNVNGQAWPGRRWSGMPRATEAAYLLVPPLRRDERGEISRLYFERRPDGRPGQAELIVKDGRRYVLDASLRPLRCAVTDSTLAARIAPGHPMAPLLYLHDGRREAIDLVVGAPPESLP